MQNGPIKIEQDIYCKNKGTDVNVTVTQAPGETPEQTLDRFLQEVEALEKSCE